MKLTKDIVNTLKFHGFITSAAPTEEFLNSFDTLEALESSGFLTDPDALKFIKSVFNDTGENVVGPTTEADVEEAPVETTVETLVEEAPVEETIVETTPPVEIAVEEAPVEEAPVETTVEEVSVEKKPKTKRTKKES